MNDNGEYVTGKNLDEIIKELEKEVDLRNPKDVQKALEDIEKEKLEKQIWELKNKEEIDKFSDHIASKLPKIEDTWKKLQDSKSLVETRKVISEFREKMKTFSLDDEEKEIKKSSSKNAYEIRSDILGMAINWLQLETYQPAVSAKYGNDEYEYFRSGDAVIDLAKKFYKFVENKK